jgi:putative ABC transport system permease protein
VRSLLNLTATDPGFRGDHMIVARVVMPAAFGSDTARRRLFFETAVERLAALPGVEAVSAASSIPFDGSYSSSGVSIVGRTDPANPRGHDAQQRTVMPNYFAFMGTPIVAGREFSRDDHRATDPVLIVNEAFVRRELPNENAVGTRVKYQDKVWTIIGVARDTRFRRLATPPEPMLYIPAGMFEGRYGSLHALLVRTTLDPTDMLPTVRSAITALEGGPAISSIRTMEDRIRESFAEERFRTTLISSFGILAALLAAVGMYGVTARAVNRRTREVGIRVALGASRARVIRLMLRSTMIGAGAGVLVGLGASIGTTRLIADYLYEVDSRDPVTYGSIVAFLAVVAMIASFLPARRAASVHPAAVLRGE